MSDTTKTTEQRRNELIDEWKAFCEKHGITHTSMDEVDTDQLSHELAEAVFGFQDEWDANEERALDERTEARDNQINEARAALMQRNSCTSS